MFDGSSVEVFSTLKANLLQSDATGSLSIIIQCSAYWHSIHQSCCQGKSSGLTRMSSLQAFFFVSATELTQLVLVAGNARVQTLHTPVQSVQR